MRLFLAVVALVSTAVAVVPASALSVPTSHGLASMLETIQEKPQSEPVSGKHKHKQCFVGCWNSCWGLYCADRCQCRCSDEKPDYCRKVKWGLRFF